MNGRRFFRRFAIRIILSATGSKLYSPRTTQSGNLLPTQLEAARPTIKLDMDHPNIAKVLDAGMTERRLPSRPPDGDRDVAIPMAADGPYSVMELVRGIRITDNCVVMNAQRSVGRTVDT